jgi:putative toxin-antitoxin system antitoxin component (TIGR02293 family)
MADMKNKTDYKQNASAPMKAEEASFQSAYQKKSSSIKVFTFNDFKKISAKVDFSQKEWSEILHISERTLQRYAHDNGTFNSGAIDRLFQINKVLDRGKEVFGSYEKFNLWLRDDPYMLEGHLSVHSLASIEGINNILTQLGRIEHGIFA